MEKAARDPFAPQRYTVITVLFLLFIIGALTSFVGWRLGWNSVDVLGLLGVTAIATLPVAVVAWLIH